MRGGAGVSDFVISQVRTWAPIIVGALISWGVLPEDLSTEAALALSGGIMGAYYLVVRLLEEKWPVFGWLLGKATPAGTPTYMPPAGG